MKIVHIADIHWRGLSRHDEYIESFKDFFKSCRSLSPDVIYVGGDIVHSKTQGISPELIENLTWWFEELCKICPVHVILGNHDGLIMNKDRQDAITPILSAIGNKNIHLYKKSGIYPTGISGFNWCVFSCFDEEGWPRVVPVDNEINIALFHGPVWGSKTDIDWEIDGDVTDDFFDMFDFTMLGDIHRAQFLNKEKTMAYCGSSIQQNYGESQGKGFLFWDIKDKNDFTVKFYPILHSTPFVTIEWKGNVEDTINEAKRFPKKSRFRIKSDTIITQADSQEIGSILKKQHFATEVVFKNDHQFDPKKYHISIGNNSETLNLRDPSFHKFLFKDFFKNSNLLDEESEDMNNLIVKYISEISEKDEILRNSRWEIENIKFDNLFAYGKNNYINFKSNPGITGIFGKNARGKSSIIGSMMYCLFNTTDRGSVKNLHIINTRKNSCHASIEINLNGEKFRIKRSTVKHTTRKGEEYASTSLQIERIDESGSVVENLSEEQRRETEKTLRRMIGISDDFLMTSLASQGGMNNFLNEGATSRKSILTKFLDLEVFDKMNDMCKRDSSQIRDIMRSIENKDWDVVIPEVEIEIEKKKLSLTEISNKISLNRKILGDLRVKIASSDSSSSFTIGQVNEQKKVVKSIDIESNKVLDRILSEKEGALDLNEKLEKIISVVDSVSIEELKSQRDAKISLEKTSISLCGQRDGIAKELERIEKSAESLSIVPCGDQYPSCMFIKSSHEDKAMIKDHLESLSETLDEIERASDCIKVLSEIDPEDKIRKYNALISRQKDLEHSIIRSNSNIENLTDKSLILKEKLSKEKARLDEMNLMILSDDESIVHDKIDNISKFISNLDLDKNSIIEEIATLKIRKNSLSDDRDRFKEIKDQLKIYDLFMQASSKKGIPLRIMMSRLPIINSEISKILLGVVDFTINLEADSDSNSMDIYIDYGDSKRVIELASGMEKMIASLAIRVALINTSSLTKTNMIIIDEGFGALDETNLESCARLLESLKRWFRNIIVISHVDAVKDCVDGSLEITKNGKDSYVYCE